MPVLNSINQMLNEMKEWRRYLHQNPEIGLKEFNTSKYISNKLESWNISFEKGLANTGIVAWIEGKGGKSKKSIGLRADIDALPMTEKNEFIHKSKNNGMMHACGHDGHTSMLLGAAKYLSENNDFNGTVFLIFQPGEEGFGGAKIMIDEGLFKKYQIDEVYALHNWPEMPIGQFGVSKGPMMAAVDQFDIIVKGKGGHAAMPDQTIDPIIIASEIILSLQTIVSRYINPIDSAVLSVTKVHGGSAYNVIDDETVISGTVRTFKPKIRDLIEKKIKENSLAISKMHNGKAEIIYNRSYPPTINSDKESDFAANVAKELVGKENVNTNIDPSMGSEDFSYMLNKKPGSYLYIGQKDIKHSANLHTTKYDFNDDLLPIGASFWVKLVQKFFQ